MYVVSMPWSYNCVFELTTGVSWWQRLWLGVIKFCNFTFRAKQQKRNQLKKHLTCFITLWRHL